MANMSYCRFQNTLLDLQDCAANMNDIDLSEDEQRAKRQLLELCKYLTEEFPLEEE